MSKFQLYIGNQRVELYDDEPVNLTETIQNIRDISKSLQTSLNNSQYLQVQKTIKYSNIIIDST